MPRLIVRTQPARGSAPRYRAGLGPFGREPVAVEASDAQARELMADPALLVAQAGGEPDAAKTAPESPSGADMPRKRARRAQEASE